MAIFFFDFRSDECIHADMYGEEFENLGEAKAMAQILLSEIAWGELPDERRLDYACEVRDQTGTVVYRGEVTFRGRSDLASHAVDRLH